MKRILTALAVLFAGLLFYCPKTYAKEYQEIPLMYKMHSTAYCLDGYTYTGDKVRRGICASGKPELVGKTLILYKRLPNGKLGDYIGTYECLDTGCAKTVIDVWTPEEDVQEFMNLVYEDDCAGKIFVQIIDAKG